MCHRCFVVAIVLLGLVCCLSIRIAKKIITWKMMTWIEIPLENHYMDGQIPLENNYMEDDYVEIEIPLENHDVDGQNPLETQMHGG